MAAGVVGTAISLICQSDIFSGRDISLHGHSRGCFGPTRQRAGPVWPYMPVIEM